MDNADVGVPQHAEAKGIDHVEDGIEPGHALPEAGQQVDGVEHAAQIGQRGEDEGRDDGDIVESLGIQGIDESGHRQQGRGEQHHAECDEGMGNVQVREQQRDAGHHPRHQHAAHDPARHEARQNDVAGHRRHQQLFHKALELGAEERADHVGVGAGDHRHHDQARHDVVDIVVPAHGADARADQVAENDEVQRHGDRRRHQGLRPDAQEAADFLAENRFKGDGMAAQSIRCHGFAHACPLAAASPCGLAATNCTNNSSSRLALLRMKRTWMPREASHSNKPLRS